MVKQAIILAGGFGTRLQTVVNEVPKPMAPVGGRPFLEYVMDHCKLYGIEKIILAVGYKHEIIIEHFSDNYRGIQLEYSIEHEALGTGGGILQAAQMLEEEAFFVLNGDTLFKVDLQELGKLYEEKKAGMVLALCEMKNFDRYGIVALNEEQRVLSFIEKQYQSKGNINAGVYVLNNEILRRSKLRGRFSFEKDFMEAFVGSYQFYGSVSSDYFIDIGIPEDYRRAEEELL